MSRNADLFVQVLRYSALGFGVAYGIRHQSTLTAKAKQNQIERDQLSLVESAKKEYAKKFSPKEEGSKCKPFLSSALGTWFFGPVMVFALGQSCAGGGFGLEGSGVGRWENSMEQRAAKRIRAIQIAALSPNANDICFHSHNRP